MILNIFAKKSKKSMRIFHPVKATFIMLNVIMLNVMLLNFIMLNAIMLIVIMLTVIILNVIMVNVIMPNTGYTKGGSITVPLTSCFTGLDSAV